MRRFVLCSLGNSRAPAVVLQTSLVNVSNRPVRSEAGVGRAFTVQQEFEGEGRWVKGHAGKQSSIA